MIDAFSRVVRLGEGLAQTGRLSQAAMDRALTALQVCADKLRRRNVHLARSVATEACRRAENGFDFIERVHAETGIRLDIISAKEEARLAVLGCHLLLEAGERVIGMSLRLYDARGTAASAGGRCTGVGAARRAPSSARTRARC